jgi:plasmid maintenance system antidote protein VapI
MALRLAKVLGGAAGDWLAMQIKHDLWQVGRRISLGHIKKIRAIKM